MARHSRSTPTDSDRQSLVRFESRTTYRFRKCFRQLPRHMQQLARVAYKHFLVNPAHPGLNFKQVHPSKPIYSARIGIDYRALGVLAGDCVIWFWIGDHEAYDRVLRDL